MPNDDYIGRTALLIYKCCILYIYSTNTGTEYFNIRFYLFKMQFHNCNIFGSYFIQILYTGCAKIKKIIPAAKG